MSVLKQVLIFYCLSFVLTLNAQNNGDGILLKSILNDIASKHKIYFNYIEDEISIFKITPPNSNLNLNEKLNYISLKTDLKFEFISPNYISIINNKKLDKPLCAYLKDKETNEPIEGVLIEIVSLNTRTLSNKDGYFELDNKSEYLIKFSLLGYQTLTLQSKDIYVINCPTIYLEKSVTLIEEINTSIYLTKGVSKTDNGTFEIKPKRFGILPGFSEPDVFQTLQQIPGITSADETISNINVRGGTHDQNYISWNGIRLFQTGHFFGLISALNPNLANKISISKNGSSAFQTEGVSSNITISTHDHWIEKNQTTLGVNLLNVDFYSKIKTSKKSNLELSARRSITDFYKSPTYKRYYNRVFQNTVVTNLENQTTIPIQNKDNFYFYDFTTQFHQKIGNKNDLFIDFIHISNHFELEQNKLDSQTFISRNSFLKQQSSGGNVTFKRNWNSKNSTEINLYASNYILSSVNESILNNQIFTQENNVLDTGIQLSNFHKVSNQFSFNNGYQLNEIGIRNIDKITSPAYSRKVKEVLVSHAIIFEGIYTSKNEKIKTILGLRNQYYEALPKWLFEPRMTFIYSFIKNVKVEIQTERKHQATSQIIDLQQDFLGVEKRRWILSNGTDIPIITNQQVSIGLHYANEKKWLLSAEGFYKEVDGITTMSQGFQNQFEFTKSTGKYETKGFEGLIQKQWKRWTTWISYTLTFNEYHFFELTPNTFPNNFDIRHHIGSALIYDYKKLKLAFGGRWFTGKPITLPQSNTPIFTSPETPEIVYNEPNSSRLEDFIQFTISGSYQIIQNKKNKLTLGFSILNLFENQSIFNQFYKINTSSNTIEQKNSYTLERTPNVFLRYTF